MKSLLLVLALVSFNSFAGEVGESKTPEKCEFSNQTVKREDNKGYLFIDSSSAQFTITVILLSRRKSFSLATFAGPIQRFSYTWDITNLLF